MLVIQKGLSDSFVLNIKWMRNGHSGRRVGQFVEDVKKAKRSEVCTLYADTLIHGYVMNVCMVIMVTVSLIHKFCYGKNRVSITPLPSINLMILIG